MNKTLQDFARKRILDGLLALPAGWQERFKLMYGRANGTRSVEDATALPIADVVAAIPADALDWALTQVEASMKKQGMSLAQAPAQATCDSAACAESVAAAPGAYAAAGPAEPATGESSALDDILGWICIHKDNPEPQLVKLADRRVVAMRKKLANTWTVYTVTRRSAMLANPAWAGALSAWVLDRLAAR